MMNGISRREKLNLNWYFVGKSLKLISKFHLESSFGSRVQIKCVYE